MCMPAADLRLRRSVAPGSMLGVVLYYRTVAHVGPLVRNEDVMEGARNPQVLVKR